MDTTIFRRTDSGRLCVLLEPRTSVKDLVRELSQLFPQLGGAIQ